MIGDGSNASQNGTTRLQTVVTIPAFRSGFRDGPRRLTQRPDLPNASEELKNCGSEPRAHPPTNTHAGVGAAFTTRTEQAKGLIKPLSSHMMETASGASGHAKVW